jgi:hypothetical protein
LLGGSQPFKHMLDFQLLKNAFLLTLFIVAL